jgi:hypothetical protein
MITYFKTSDNINPETLRHFPEKQNSRQRRHVSLKSSMITVLGSAVLHHLGFSRIHSFVNCISPGVKHPTQWGPSKTVRITNRFLEFPSFIYHNLDHQSGLSEFYRFPLSISPFYFYLIIVSDRSYPYPHSPRHTHTHTYTHL